MRLTATPSPVCVSEALQVVADAPVLGEYDSVLSAGFHTNHKGGQGYVDLPDYASDTGFVRVSDSRGPEVG